MKVVGKKELEEAKKLPPVPEKKNYTEKTVLSEKEIEEAIRDMANPVEAQKRLAVQVKNFLDQRIKEDMETKGFLSDHTRRWCDLYNNILEKIQRALYGDKASSVNLHLIGNVTHSQVAARIRRATETEIVDEVIEEKGEKKKVE